MIKSEDSLEERNVLVVNDLFDLEDSEDRNEMVNQGWVEKEKGTKAVGEVGREEQISEKQVLEEGKD